MDTIPAPLKGKVALVTGGSRGIGKATTLTLARHGCTHIAITYRSNETAAKEVCSDVQKINPDIKTLAISARLTDANFGETVVKQMTSGLEVDHIDIIVSNAALMDQHEWVPVEKLSKEKFDEQMTGDAWAPLSLAKEAIGFMPRGGRIVMTSTCASKLPAGDPFVGYAAAKAAMDSIARNLASIYAVKHDVTVNTISVGSTQTDAMDEALEVFGPGFTDYATQFPLNKRVSQAQEVADIIAFVASPQAAIITGNQIPANGGGLSCLQG